MTTEQDNAYRRSIAESIAQAGLTETSGVVELIERHCADAVTAAVSQARADAIRVVEEALDQVIEGGNGFYSQSVDVDVDDLRVILSALRGEE